MSSGHLPTIYLRLQGWGGRCAGGGLGGGRGRLRRVIGVTSGPVAVAECRVARVRLAGAGVAVAVGKAAGVAAACVEAAVW